MADWADLLDGTAFGHRCCYCRRRMDMKNLVKSPHSDRLYCHDRLIYSCNNAFGARVQMLQTQGWKLVPVG